MRWLILSMSLWLVFPAIVGAQPTTDACRRQIAPELGEALQERLPGYRLPSASDSLADNVQLDRSQGGNGCLLVARADFNGDGREDMAVGLAANARSAPLVAIALVRDRGWRIATVRRWVDDIQRLYVRSGAPSLHTKIEARWWVFVDSSGSIRTGPLSTLSATYTDRNEAVVTILSLSGRTWTHAAGGGWAITTQRG